jgi:cytochrome c-type biogenesis protein CcsB
VRRKAGVFFATVLAVGLGAAAAQAGGAPAGLGGAEGEASPGDGGAPRVHPHHGAHFEADGFGPAAEPEPRASLEGALDLTALRSLTVQDGGRRKPLDTFAREKVLLILGYERFRGEDPLYTFLSLLFEADRWAPIRAFKIHNLKLIELFKTGSNRVSFDDIERNGAFRERLQAIDMHSAMPESAGETAVLELNQRAMMFANLPRFLRVAPVPGEPEDAAWSDVTELRGQPDAVRSEVHDLFRRAAEAFRAGEAAAANEALRALARGIASIQGPKALPAWSARLEVAMNRVAPFRHAWMVLVGAAALLGWAYLAESRKAYALGLAFLLAGVGLGLFGVAARTLIVGRAPVANLYEATIFFSFMAVLVGTIFEVAYRSALFGAAAATFGFLAFLLADIAPSMERAINPIQPVLVSYWLNIHVTCMLTSYGAFAVAFLLGVIYYAKYLPAKGLPKFSILVPVGVALSGLGVLLWKGFFAEGRPSLFDYALALVGTPLLAVLAGWGWLRVTGKSANRISFEDDLTLKLIERNLYRVCQVGFVIITAGIILGAVWANESWGRYWGWDPKETWAFITWLLYGVFIHGRMAGWFRGPRAAIWGIIGFYSVLFTFFGVSFVLPGLHSYLKS